MTSKDLTQKKEIILRHELAFANEIGAAVFEKPRVSFWMVFIPILFLYFIYRMQKFKSDRAKFDDEFMTGRRRAMDIALGDAAADGITEMDWAALGSELPAPLQKPYIYWIKSLSSHYLDLLTANGDDFESLVRTVYCNRNNYLLTLDRLNNAEKEFYAALKPFLGSVEGTADIIATIESQSRRLRSDMVDRIFC